MAKQRKTPSRPTIDPALRADIEAAIPPASNLSAALLSFLRGAYRRGLSAARIAEILSQHGYQITAEGVAAQLAPRTHKPGQPPAGGASTPVPPTTQADGNGESSDESAAAPEAGASDLGVPPAGRNGA